MPTSSRRPAASFRARSAGSEATCRQAQAIDDATPARPGPVFHAPSWSGNVEVIWKVAPQQPPDRCAAYGRCVFDEQFTQRCREWLAVEHVEKGLARPVGDQRQDFTGTQMKTTRRATDMDAAIGLGQCLRPRDVGPCSFGWFSRSGMRAAQDFDDWICGGADRRSIADD